MTETHKQPRAVWRYGAEGESLILADGAALAVRRASPADAAALLRFYDALSPRSRYQRFFAPLAILTVERARAFSQLDRVGGYALVALDPAPPRAIVAVVSYGREAGAARAEYAAAVADAWQGRGVGLALTRRLVAAARARGVARLTAAVLPENAQMRGVLAALGLATVGRWEGGVVRFELDLGLASPESGAAGERPHRAA